MNLPLMETPKTGFIATRPIMSQMFSLFPEKPESVQPAEGQVLCKVCGDIANGIHFGVNTCEGCKVNFFAEHK